MEQGFLTQEPGLEYYKNLLRNPGASNDHLESTLPEEPDFEEYHDISNPYSTSHLNQILVNERKNVLHQNPLYYIANTKGGPGNTDKGWKDGRKGHDVRYMGVWRQQGELPPVSETYYKGLNVAEALRDITFKEIWEGYGIVGGSMQSVDNQVHFIASDLETGPGAESDLKGLNNWFLYRVEEGEAVELEEYKSREKIGDYLEELLL